MSRAFSKMEGKLRSSEAESLLTLLQDRDEVALALVRDRIMFLGWPAVSYCFENLTRVVPSDRRAAVRRFLHSISSSCSVDELERLLEEGNFFFVPDGLYYLSRILMPELTPGDFHESYLELAGDLMGELRDNMTAVEKVEMLNYIVFERYGFQLSRGGDCLRYIFCWPVMPDFLYIRCSLESRDIMWLISKMEGLFSPWIWGIVVI